MDCRIGWSFISLVLTVSQKMEQDCWNYKKSQLKSMSPQIQTIDACGLAKKNMESRRG